MKTNLNRMVSYLLIFIMLMTGMAVYHTPAVYGEETVSLVLTGGTIDISSNTGTVTVPVNISGNPSQGISTANILVKYDSGLKLESISADGALFGSASFITNVSTGKIAMTTGGAVTGDGVLFNMTFSAGSDTGSGTYNINLITDTEADDYMFRDGNENGLNVNVTSASVNVENNSNPVPVPDPDKSVSLKLEGGTIDTSSNTRTVTVPVSISGNPAEGISTANMLVKYDSGLKLESISAGGALFAGASFVTNADTGKIAMTTGEAVTGDGVLFNMTFSAGSDTGSGTYNINLITDTEADDYMFRDGNENGLNVNVTSATINVKNNSTPVPVPDPDKNVSLRLEGGTIDISSNTRALTVPVSISGNPAEGISTANMLVKYDSGLKLESISADGALFANASFAANVSTGKIAMTTGGAVTGDGVLFNMVFSADSGTKTGTYKVNLVTDTSADDYMLRDGQEKGLSVSEASADIVVTERSSDSIVVTFDPNGGSLSEKYTVIGDSGKLEYFPVPVRSGYTFRGWYDAAVGGNSITRDTIFTKSTVIYAQWNRRSTSSHSVTTYRLIFNVNGGSQINSYITNNQNEIVDLSKFTTVKNGYDFDGWYSDAGFTSKIDRVTLTGESTTVYAKWVEKDAASEPDDEPDPTPAPNPAPEKNDFSDVSSGAYYTEAVYWAVERGITNGTGYNMFSPERSCTRAEMVTFLWRSAGSPQPSSTSNPFSDLDASAYYGTAALWAVEKGITQGTGDGRFSPDATVDRAQTVTFIYRAAGAVPVNSGSQFSDVKSGDYFADAVQWASANNVAQGTGENLFSPYSDCTRAQIVTLLYRYYAV